ncbi:hypothetical protein M6B38_360955 [Iris pallida]|uniref:Uncharacterized protein n=1 Tax=Iris pallida TaxID=29817 RepID=A0AAX6G848_IRIPA|nr:hypothetical protein M6B38_382030 [Iris pallida]KAJ6829292.1 hypothetical protein M6B38_360955 [Iris pallida]
MRGMCSDLVCYFFVSFCIVRLCFVVTSDGCLWFRCLSGMETTNVGYVYFVVIWIMLWLDK